MYGYVHQVLVRFIKSRPNGEEELKEIYRQMDDSIEQLNFYKSFSDNHTSRFIEATSKVTGLSQNQIFKYVGAFSFDVFVEQGYLPLLQTLGDTFFECIKNIDTLHTNLVNTMPSMRAPSFKPVKNSDGTLTVHYYSSRDGLAPFAIAVMKGVASGLFDLDIQVHHKEKKGIGSDHDIFVVHLDPRGFPPEPTDEELEEQERLSMMSVMSLAPQQVTRLFPWYFAFDYRMKIVSVGVSLAMRFNENIIGQRMDKVMHVVRPKHLTTFNDFADLSEQLVLVHVRDSLYKERKNRRRTRSLRCDSFDSNIRRQSHHETPHSPLSTSNITKRTANLLTSENLQTVANNGLENKQVSSSRGSSFSQYDGNESVSVTSATSLTTGCITDNNHTTLHLQGEMVLLKDSGCILFVGIPSVTTMKQMTDQQIRLADFPIHSHGQEMLFSTVHQSATVSMASDLASTTANLDSAMRELDVERGRMNDLLHSILPPPVADTLAKGKVPPAETYENVGILFSDICGFTNLSASVEPTEIMDMLNELFSKYDALCEKHGVYKVETIGDAYMVASGLHERSRLHAENLAMFAVDMVKVAQTVFSPADKKPLKIRVGLHTGRVMAGVVGQSRPRYCLFGDTVNVSSRMESTAIPNTVQVSYAFLKALPDRKRIAFKERGNMPIKGKGVMKTIFILGREDDKFNQLQLPEEVEPQHHQRDRRSTAFSTTPRFVQRNQRISFSNNDQFVKASPLARYTNKGGIDGFDDFGSPYAVKDPKLPCSDGRLSFCTENHGSFQPEDEEAFFDVILWLDGEEYAVSFVDGETTLIRVAEEVFGNKHFNFFSDATMMKLVVPKQTILQLYKAQAAQNDEFYTTETPTIIFHVRHRTQTNTIDRSTPTQQHQHAFQFLFNQQQPALEQHFLKQQIEELQAKLSELSVAISNPGISISNEKQESDSDDDGGDGGGSMFERMMDAFGARNNINDKKMSLLNPIATPSSRSSSRRPSTVTIEF
eukprot:m.183298 g.183298  ORF g.183298 m.183298 type:complete len:996 (-) comp13592_c0_seq21:982-3969(-)